MVKAAIFVLTVASVLALAPGLLVTSWVFDTQLVMTAVTAVLAGRQFRDIYSEFYQSMQY